MSGPPGESVDRLAEDRAARIPYGAVATPREQTYRPPQARHDRSRSPARSHDDQRRTSCSRSPASRDRGAGWRRDDDRSRRVERPGEYASWRDRPGRDLEALSRSAKAGPRFGTPSVHDANTRADLARLASERAAAAYKASLKGKPNVTPAGPAAGDRTASSRSTETNRSAADDPAGRDDSGRRSAERAPGFPSGPRESREPLMYRPRQRSPSAAPAREVPPPRDERGPSQRTLDRPHADTAAPQNMHKRPDDSETRGDRARLDSERAAAEYKAQLKAKQERERDFVRARQEAPRSIAPPAVERTVSAAVPTVPSAVSATPPPTMQRAVTLGDQRPPPPPMQAAARSSPPRAMPTGPASQRAGTYVPPMQRASTGPSGLVGLPTGPRPLPTGPRASLDPRLAQRPPLSQQHSSSGHAEPHYNGSLQNGNHNTPQPSRPPPPPAPAPEPEDPAVAERRARIRQWEAEGIRRYVPPPHIAELERQLEQVRRDCELIEREHVKRQRNKRLALNTWHLLEHDCRRENYKTELAEASLITICNASL